MKTKTLYYPIIVLSFLFISQAINAAQVLVNQDGPGLEIASTLKYHDERISDYTLIIYDENQSADTFQVSKVKTLYLKLSYGHTYSFRYIKKGFRERVVMLDTRIDEEIQSKDTGFDFEIEMIPEHNTGNTISDLPVALIHYNTSEHKFEYSRNYHRQVRNKEIKEIDY